MPDILGYADRWADTWYYPRTYEDLTKFEKWFCKNYSEYERAPRKSDKTKYENYLVKEKLKRR
jgi:hypothetical protein